VNRQYRRAAKVKGAKILVVCPACDSTRVLLVCEDCGNTKHVRGEQSLQIATEEPERS
jgi:ribosomal protein L32